MAQAPKKPASKKTPPKKKTAATRKPRAKKDETSDLRSSKKVAEHLDKQAKTKKAEAKQAEAEKEHNQKLDLLAKVLGYDTELADIQKSITELVGKMGSRVKTILQVEDWNRGGFSDIMKIMKMSEAKRADYLRTFHALYSILYEERWESELHDLLTQLEKEANTEADLQGDDDVPAEFKEVDVAAELEEPKPKSKPKTKAKEAPVDPEIEEETKAFEADAAELEKMMAEE